MSPDFRVNNIKIPNLVGSAQEFMICKVQSGHTALNVYTPWWYLCSALYTSVVSLPNYQVNKNQIVLLLVVYSYYNNPPYGIYNS